ncbi:MAG: hypothetical protein GEU81_03965 [Nitriliruptorales bacterium]|nr:hypothetical protein [Nitriliruptorales bacterium]
MTAMSERCAEVEPLLSAWLDGALQGQEWAQVGRHLTTCPRCRAELDSLRVTANLLRGGPLRTPPQQVSAALAHPRPAAVRGLEALAPGLRRLLSRVVVLLLSIVTVLFAAAFVLGGNPDPGPPVRVPVETFVADHLVRTRSVPISTPELFEVDP